MNRYIKQLKEGILDQNPTLVQLLGMCPTLATTTSLENAFGMGMAATAVLICSNVFISLLRKFIPRQVRIAAYIVIVSGFVTAVELLMRAYLYSLYQALGLFIPLIVVNCIILARAEAFASKNKVLPSAMDGLAMGLGFTFALCILGTVRELLGSGSVLGFRVLPEAYPEMVVFLLPPGAFLTLGFVIAAVQKLRGMSEERRRRRTGSGTVQSTEPAIAGAGQSAGPVAAGTEPAADAAVISASGAAISGVPGDTAPAAGSPDAAVPEQQADDRKEGPKT